ncbi:MAG: dienelactone hydrolase family protein [Acidimicrobiia bacterium]
MAFRQYVAEEIAADAVDGIISRREALRRLGLLGVSATTAAVLLAACGGDDDDGAGGSGASPEDEVSVPDETATSAGADSGGTAPAGTEKLNDGSDLLVAYAEADPPQGAVLVIHENKGLTAHFKDFPGRLAADGYTAMAPDLLSRQGGTDSFSDQAEATAALTGRSNEDLVADLTEVLDELARRAPEQKLGVMGFCFGGGMTWSLLASGEGRAAAAIPFYGPLPEGADFSGTQAAVLAVYAELDERVNASRDAAVAALQAAGLTHEVKTYPGVMHAFFNDTGPRYDEAAATDAYTAVLDWFGRHLS